MRNIYLITLSTTLIFIGHVSFSQHRYSSDKSYDVIGISVNAINYVGDLDPSSSYISPGLKFTRPNIGVHVMHRINHRMFTRAAFSWGQIGGSDVENSSTNGNDRFRRVRNLSFRNNIYELKIDAIFDFYPNERRYTHRPDFTPYVFGGIGVFYHNPQAKLNGQWYNLKPLSTEGQGLSDNAPKPYSLIQFTMPVGFGFRYKLNKRFDLAFEIGWRFTSTDYLDDVGGRYADPNLLLSERGPESVALADRTNEGYLNGSTTSTVKELGYWTGSDVHGYGEAGDQRGDLQGRNDWYIITGFQVNYILEDRIRCPKFRGTW